MATIGIWGDSIVWGAYDQKGGWVNRLNQDFIYIEKTDIDIYNLGVPGDTTQGLLKRFEGEVIAREPSHIILAIGVNDSSFLDDDSQNQRVSVIDFKQNLIQLIEIAKKNSKNIALIGLMPVNEFLTMPIPWSPTQSYSNSNIKMYNQVIKEVAAVYSLPYLELFDLLEVDDLRDGLHPNDQGHEKVYKKVKSFLVNNFELINANNINSLRKRILNSGKESFIKAIS